MALVPEVTLSADMPVSLAEMKAQAVVDFNDDDMLLGSYLRAATSYLDGPTGVLGRALVSQTVVQRFPGFGDLRLPYGPANTLTSIQYYDAAGDMQTLADGRVLTDESGSYIALDEDCPETYDRPDAVIVTYQAGFSGAVPSGIKQAILMLAAAWYCQRESLTDARSGVSKVPFGFDALIAPHRKVGV